MITFSRKKAQPQPKQFQIATPEEALAFCDGLDHTLDAITALIDRETAHLKAMEIAEAELLQVEKSELAARLNQEITFFKTHADSIRALTPEPVEALAVKHDRLRTSIRANEEILTTLRSVSESLIRKTAERMAAKTAGPRTYSREASPTTQPASTSIALDRRL